MAPDPAPVAVRVAAITRADLTRTISYVGTIHSRQEVKVLAQTAGRVVSLAGEGEIARQGQALAKIAAPETNARFFRMEAEVQRAITERDFSCKTHARDRRLGGAGVISQAQVDASRRACDAANAALAAARAGSREVGAAKQRASETAPFGGRVLQWLVEPGQNVMPGTPLLLYGSHDLEVRAAVAERDLENGVRGATSAIVQLRGQSLRLPVAKVAPLAVGPSRTTEVTIPLPADAAPALGHGTSVRVGFVIAEAASAVAVPEQAITGADGERVVFVIDGGRALAVPVIPGVQDRGLVAVDGALTAGGVVAVSNLELLQEGTKVYAVRQAGGDEVRP